MGSIFIVVSVKTARSPFVCIPNLAATKINRGGRERAKWTRNRSPSIACGRGGGGLRSLWSLRHEPPGACQMSYGTAHGTAHFAAHFVHFCTSLPHPPHSRTLRQNPKLLQTRVRQCYQRPSETDGVPALSLPTGHPRRKFSAERQVIHLRGLVSRSTLEKFLPPKLAVCTNWPVTSTVVPWPGTP